MTREPTSPDTTPAAADLTEGQASEMDRPVILLVEDEALTIMDLGDVLENGGYETVHPSFELGVYDDPEQRGFDEAKETLLQRLKRDLLHRRPPPRPASRRWPRPAPPRAGS